MSQPQMQYRSAIMNGAGRRRSDRDLGNRAENFVTEYQNYKPFHPARSGTEASGQHGHQNLNITSSYAEHVGVGRLVGDRDEIFLQRGSKSGGLGPLNERLIYMTACLIGQPVEVQVKNGSIYSGVFHTANAEKDYGVVLKMARLVKDGSIKGVRTDAAKDLIRRPVKTFIIHAKDLVQIIAKDVPLSGDSSQNGRSRENRTELLTDSFLSQGRHAELERELKPWTPDKDDPKDLGLDSTFQSTWNRNWDQFEINKNLFGVESTFDEEIYTTKLERGPQTRELEREAWRIAREIEGLSSKNLHVAEERGMHLSADLDVMDEESRFSSVLRSSNKLDLGEETEDTNIDMHNNETFGSSFDEVDASRVSSTEDEPSMKSANELDGRSSRSLSSELNEARNKKDQSYAGTDTDAGTVDVSVATSKTADTNTEKLRHAGVGDRNKRSVKVGGLPSPLVSPLIAETTSIQALNLDPGLPQVTEDVYREFNEFRQQENAKRGKKQREEQVNELKSFSESLKDLRKDMDPRFSKLSIKSASSEGGPRQPTNTESKPTTAAAACAPPASALPIPTSITPPTSTYTNAEATASESVQSHTASSGAAPDTLRIVPTSNSDVGSIASASRPEVPSSSGTQSGTQNSDLPVSPLNSTTSNTAPSSPSSSSGVSTGPILIKKSSLNPNAKEFKLNPNAKSFTPSFTPVRPSSPVVQGSVYVPGGMPPVAPLQAVQVGVGVNPLIQQQGQGAAKFTPYSPVAVAGSGTAPFLQSPGATYTPGVSGAGVPPTLAGQTALKMQPQLQPPAVGHSYGSQQAIRFTSQAPPVQPASTYLHPTSQLYSQQMMYGQPGQVVYFQPFPQGPPMPPPQPAQTTSQQQQQQQQQQQPRHHGTGVQAMQFCVAPPFMAGQQHFLPQVQMSQLHSPMPPTPGVLAPTTLPGIQPSQGVVGGIVPPAQSSGSLSGTNPIRVGGKVAGGTFQ